MTNEEKNTKLSAMFPPPEKRETVRPNRRNYDVRITLNRSGKNRDVVRFGFINYAANVFGQSQFIEASDIEITKNRIYFRTHSEKTHRNIHTLSTNSETKNESCYFAITPSVKSEKIYRMNWIGKTYKICFDACLELYYIENTKEG